MNDDDYKAYLYDESRLQLREEIFLGESIPALAAASSNHELKHIVSFSASLPEVRKEALRQAAVRYPFISQIPIHRPRRSTGRYKPYEPL